MALPGATKDEKQALGISKQYLTNIKGNIAII